MGEQLERKIDRGESTEDGSIDASAGGEKRCGVARIELKTRLSVDSVVEAGERMGRYLLGVMSLARPSSYSAPRSLVFARVACGHASPHRLTPSDVHCCRHCTAHMVSGRGMERALDRHAPCDAV
jgi:hypothetical protein